MKSNVLEKAADVSSSRWRTLKNVLVISIAFMLQFTAFSGAANLQSSINAEDGLGTASLAAIYAGLITSNVFLPAIVIKWIGCKWAIAVSFITYMPYIAAQLHPRFWTLIPTGLLVGFGGGPLWCAKCTYLSMVSESQSKLSKSSAEVLLVRFLGIFFMIFQLNQVWGNIISSLVLTSGENAAAVTAVNASMIPQICGANFLPSADAGAAFLEQPAEKIQTMTGIYLACMAGASILVAIGVDSIKKFEKQIPGTTTATPALSGTALLSVTVRLMVEPTQLLLIIVCIFIGMQQAFFGVDFTASFVSCAIGTGTVGFVMTTYGIADVIGCLVTGYVAKVIGRVPIICVAFLSHGAMFITLLVWRPHPTEEYVIYIIAVVWGLSDSIWMVQMNAYYGALFPGREEAAFSNFRLWESVGFIIEYIISPNLRTSVKTYILLILMIVGTVGYFSVEYRELRARKRRQNTETVTCIDIGTIKGCDNVAFQNAE